MTLADRIQLHASRFLHLLGRRSAGHLRRADDDGRPFAARSLNDTIFFGFPGAVTIVSVLDAKFTGSPATSFASVALSMFFVSADANTSAGAPCVNWVTRSEDPAKENSMSLPGLSVLNCSPMSVKDFFSDAGAKTQLSAARCFRRRRRGGLVRRTAAGSGKADDGYDGRNARYKIHDCPPGVSTITVVALTTATATLPGSSFSSRAASALISDTTVNGPHFIST